MCFKQFHWNKPPWLSENADNGLIGLLGQPANRCWRSLGLKHQDSIVLLGRWCISGVWYETWDCKVIPKLPLFPWNALCVRPGFSHKMEIIDKKGQTIYWGLTFTAVRNLSSCIQLCVCMSLLYDTILLSSSKPLFPAISRWWQVICCFFSFYKCLNIEMQH